MARRTNKDDLAPVLDAYNQWINRCLIEGGSVFSTQALWTSPIVEEVRRAFVDHPDEGKGDFTTKLKRQMANASPPAKQLMCEMLWALLLFPTNVKADTKREQVRDLWSLSGQQLKEDIPFLSNNVLGGIGSGGTAFNTHRWRELVFLIAIAADLSRKTTPERRQIFSAYDAFMAWMETVPREGKRQFRHMLRFAAFPDRVERMSSNGDRRRILESFGVGSRKEVRLMKDRELDDALLKLRTKLEAQYPGAVLDFYETPLRSRWQPEETSLQGELEGILSEYAQARGKETFGGQSPVFQRFRRIEAAFQETVKKGGEVRTSASPGELPDVNVKASAGAGNWATVPWIAFLDPRETVSTKKGVYCVYLFCEDMSGVYVTLNQGVTEPTQRLGWKDAETFLRDTARDIRARFPQLQNNDFNTSDNIDLHTTGTLGEMYEVSTIAYKFYEAGNIPQDEVLLDDLGHVLATYNQYVDGKSAKRPDSAWVFQANPEYFDIQGALAKLNEMTWVVRQHAESIREGDELFLWESGKDGGVVAVGRIASNPASISQLEQEKSFNLSPDRFDGVQPRVRIRVDRVLPQTIRRSTLLGHPVLESMGILTAPQGSNFKLTPLQAKELRALINGKGMALPSSDLKPLKLIVEEFDAAVSESHLSFGDNHDEILRSFVVSLAAKRFVILTGLSGSGKTQLALRFGEWLGTERFLSLPVRPDWTGAEALFGYEDALQQPLNGRRAWYVPKALEFILSAFHDPHQPYLLLLDEMNLAHVERYFADVLSGMESDYDCLPNLEREQGQWRLRVDEPERIRIPRNLFVIGTVNVDETTYMFSPKVLDRANTFEFRVKTNELVLPQIKPTPCAPGDSVSVRSFLAIAINDGWHQDKPAPERDRFISDLRRVHAVLSANNFEFGHRVFYEATRFAALLAAAGDPDPEHALDLQIMQKVLPRLHGSRRRLENTLCALARFCFDLTVEQGSSDAGARFDPIASRDNQPRLPRSFDKLRRMTQSIRVNQFASFTE